ncbi:probable serine/threonine-protein kinase pkgA isoform X2 [Anopheles funestus]|uniref:probable serine/threonine-protein kinase pkgA isoform X2 n=1 Tax=Anopheles funestus TaxID=62324 RepID=UPI0020C69C8F|nr:probable serine/threonine-protein kinase pkgA isoform X2 [Anopheles funestus]
MGNADIRAIEPAISCNNNPALESELQGNHNQDVPVEVQERKKRNKDNRVVSFQLPQSADGANLGLVARWYHETLAHRSYIVWLHGVVSRVANVLRTIRPNSRKRVTHRTRPFARISRRRWHQTTLDSETQLLKSCWPVPQTERLFLPTFPVDERRCERYVQRTHLADGAFGRVYRVQDACEGATLEHRPHWYALKILQKSTIVLSDAAGQVRDEVKIQTICGHHPFIVPCIDYWQNRTSIFLLSEFYGNGELFHRLKSFTVQLVQLYVAELALAIDFLHNAGIIYRDLKPENILLDDRYHIKLIDFGLSKWLSIGSRTTTLCGTIQYMVPKHGPDRVSEGSSDWAGRPASNSAADGSTCLGIHGHRHHRSGAAIAGIGRSLSTRRTRSASAIASTRSKRSATFAAATPAYRPLPALQVGGCTQYEDFTSRSVR